MRKRRCYAEQSGFTLIELLVVLGIIGILSTIGLESVSEIRESVFRATNERMVLDALTSLEAGQIDSSDFGMDWYGASWRKGELLWESRDTNDFAPGISDPGNVHLYSAVDNWVMKNDCPWSIKYQVYVRHCGGAVAETYFQYGTGVQDQWSSFDNWSC